MIFPNPEQPRIRKSLVEDFGGMPEKVMTHRAILSHGTPSRLNRLRAQGRIASSWLDITIKLQWNYYGEYY